MIINKKTIMVMRKTNLLILLFILQFLLSPFSDATGQEITWSVPQPLPGYEGRNKTERILPPLMAVDDNNTVHAFNSLWYDESLIIAYSNWTEFNGWSLPIDVVLSPNRQARIMGVVLDGSDYLNILFFGGDDRQAEMYYTRAPASQAGNAKAWEPVRKIGEKAITPSYAALNGNGNDVLLAVYSGDLDGQGLYATHSLDAGESWSEPLPIFLTYNQELWPADLNIFYDGEKYFHLVWAVYNIRGNAEEVLYSNFDLEQQVWSQPIRFVDSLNASSSHPSIIKHQSVLIVIYHNDFPLTRWMISSKDNGQTWTYPIRLFDHVGSNGAASLVIDSSNNLHMLFGNRVGNPIVHGMWHSTWNESFWSPPSPVVAGPQIRDPVNRRGFDPSNASAVMVQGNILLVTWISDPQAGYNGVWYSYKKMDTPVLPISPLKEYLQHTQPLQNKEFSDDLSSISTNIIDNSIIRPEFDQTDINYLENYSPISSLIYPIFATLSFILLTMGIRILNKRK
jgi:hypothetical protein